MEFMNAFFLICASFSFFTGFAIAGNYHIDCNIGVAYGTQGDNIPPPSRALDPLQTRVRRFRLFDPNPDLLNYCNSTQGIFTIAIGALNKDIENLSKDPNFAKAWVNTNIVRYPRVKFNYIVVGNEMIPTNVSKYVLQAMINMNSAVKQSGVPQSIKVTTVVAMGVLGVSYPPSAAVFTTDSIQIMRGIVSFLQNQGFPLFLNVYPYFAYASNPSKIRLDYALFNTTDVVIQDGNLQYKNLFYAMVDSLIWAVEKAGGSNVEIVVSETGWPSAGNTAVATVEHAKMYINNMITTLMKSGTPKRLEHAMRTHIFAMFNENKKAEGVERNFGIYRPDLTEYIMLTGLLLHLVILGIVERCETVYSAKPQCNVLQIYG